MTLEKAMLPTVEKRRAAQAKFGNSTDHEPWLQQFTPVDEATLTDRQRRFVTALRSQYPEGRVGARDDNQLCFYAIDPLTGRFCGVLPAGEEMTSRSLRRIRRLLRSQPGSRS